MAFFMWHIRHVRHIQSSNTFHQAKHSTRQHIPSRKSFDMCNTCGHLATHFTCATHVAYSDVAIKQHIRHVQHMWNIQHVQHIPSISTFDMCNTSHMWLTFNMYNKFVESCLILVPESDLKPETGKTQISISDTSVLYS